MKLAHGANSPWTARHLDPLPEFHTLDPAPPPAALRCPHCQRTVSDSDITCSHCGVMVHEPDDDQHAKGFWALAVTCLTFALIFCLAVMK